MSTALIGDHEFGTLPRWPLPEITVADFFDRPSWERPTTTRPYEQPGGTESYTGSPGFGSTGQSAGSTGTPGFAGGASSGGSTWTPGDGVSGAGAISIYGFGGTITINVEPQRRTFYNIEIHAPNGDLLTRVTDWISGNAKLQTENASMLDFMIPVNSESAAELTRPNTIWLRDRWGFVIETFQIQKRRPRGIGDAAYIAVECQSEISQLSEEVLLRYEGATLPVLDHVTAILDEQAKDSPLTLGTIDPEIADIELPFFSEDTTIHAALLQLQLALPKAQRGYIYVDPQRRVQWRMVVGDNTEQVITRQRNVYSVEAEVDYSRTVNRIFLFGEGQDTLSRLTLLDAGEPEKYIEDTDSITAYGLAPFLKVDRRIRNPETLLKTAQRILDEFSEPPVTVTVDLLDLAKSDSAPTGWEDIYLGGKYRVVDTELGINSSIEIVGIDINLAHPVPLRVDLANQTRELSDFVSEIIDALQQPLDVDGDRYPTMGRNYSDQDPREARVGDTRWNDAEDRLEAFDGDTWRGAGSSDVNPDPIWYKATTRGGLDSDVADTALGRVTAGTDVGRVFIRDYINGGWVLIAPVITVEVLPVLPTTGFEEVFWTSVGAGTGDDQVWRAHAGDTKWTPTQRFTSHSGVPV